MHTDRCGSTSGQKVAQKEAEKKQNTRDYIQRYSGCGTTRKALHFET